MGTYEYKYLVDGNWTIDEAAPVRSNDFGSLNNFIEVNFVSRKGPSKESLRGTGGEEERHQDNE